MADEPKQQPVHMQMQLPPENEVGVYADFASVWHTPSTFVLDFLSVKMPPHPQVTPEGVAISGTPVLDARVAARIRIPSEQIFPLIQALQEQGNQWLSETGRSEPPVNWVS